MARHSSVHIWVRVRISMLLVALLTWAVPAAPGAADPVPRAVLGGETHWSTPVYLLQAEQAGPTVLVLAGVHGDERAPPVAAWRLLDLELTRGRLYVVPEVNRPALAAGTRFSPRARFSDLNRNFPRRSGEPPRGFLAPVLWRAIQDIRPDWILDLHEGFDFNRRNKKSMGSSIVHVPGTSVSERALSAARAVQAAVNATIVSPSRHFTLIAPGPAGSVARSAQEVLGIPSLVFETTRIAQPIALRARQQELMVQAFLRQQSMLADSQAGSLK